MIQLVLFLFVPTISLCQNAPRVTTRTGPMEGAILTSRKGVNFYAFRGIPYAEPPIGELRFRPPVPKEPWDNVYDASKDGPVCSQPGGDDFSPKDENCLFLNVYTRAFGESDNPRPVMFWIHGGGFYQNTGQSIWFGPDYLLDHDIVLVTINYRLATLGYMSTNDKYSPGNYGMKDQVQALRWVNENIGSFGGDPNNVTIAGQSAGAASVILHMISPMSRGLFHRGIAMSGSAADAWAINKDPLSLAKKQAALLNCPTDTSENIVNCIQEIPAQQTARIYSKLWTWGYDPIVVLSPVVESADGPDEPFLAKDPVVALQEGDFANVPLIIGTTRDEFSNRAIFIVQNDSWAEDMAANWNDVAPIPFMYDKNDTISQKLREFYLGSLDGPIINDSLPALGRLYADSVIIFGVLRAAKIIASKSSEPVYVYQFNYQGEYSHAYWPGTTTPYGVIHHDDLIYLFYISKVFPRFNTTGDDANCVDRLTQLWTNFIKTGNPTPEDSEILNNVKWFPFTSENNFYLDINSNLQAVNGLYYEDRTSLWESLFPLKKHSSNYLP